MNTHNEIFNNFFEYASEYLGRSVKKVTIIENGQVVPKLDEVTTEYERYTHLFGYWEKLIRVDKL